MTSERLAEIHIIVHSAEVKGCKVDVAIAREMVDALEAARTVYISQYAMNTDPIDGVYATRELAEADDDECDNRVEKWEVQQ